MKITLLLLFLFTTQLSWSQDSLVLKTGATIAFQKIYQTDDQIEILTMDKEEQSYSCKNIFGYYDVTNDASFYLLRDSDSDDENPYIFLDRTQLGAINIYINNGREYAIYLEKDDQLRLVYSDSDSKDQFDKRINVLKSYVSDDKVTLDFIDSKDFKLKSGIIETIVTDYNKRNYKDRQLSKADLTKMVYLYRTKFQKSKENIRVTLHGQSYELEIEDYVALPVPVKYPSKLTLADEYSTTEMIISSQLTDQYYEVYYDKRSDSFLLDLKTGSELHYEFNKIKEKVAKENKRK
ncbi:MAG: hypothetical protein OCD76_17705 [Reichenbachiella sp.]